MYSHAVALMNYEKGCLSSGTWVGECNLQRVKE